MRLLTPRTAVTLCTLGISLSAGRVYALCDSNDIVQIGRLPDVIFPAGQASCAYFSGALIKVYGVTPNAFDSNCGTGARVLTGYPHIQIANGSGTRPFCSAYNQSTTPNELNEADDQHVIWGQNYLQLYSDGTPGSGTIELYAYNSGTGNQTNSDSTRNLDNYPIGYFSYFVTNDVTDDVFTQTATTGVNMGSRGNSTIIYNPALNGQPNMALNVSQVWNYGNAGGVYNNHPIAAIYGYDDPSYWSIVNSDGGAMAPGAEFNVEFVPQNPDNTFATYASSNTAESTNANSQVYSFGFDSPITVRTIMDYNSGALLFPTSLDGLDPNPNGVHFVTPTWALANANLASMIGSNFSALMIGWADPAAYIFNQSGGTGIEGDDSMYLQTFPGYVTPVALTHIFVAPQMAQSNSLPSPLGVWWSGNESGGTWAAFREDTQVMPSSASINVYAHRPAFIASPKKGDTNGDRLSDFIMVGGTSNSSIETGLAQSAGGYAWFTPLESDPGNAIDWDFITSYAQSPNVKVLSGDFDGDGRTDLALTGVSGWGNIPLALSNGDGGYRVTYNGVTIQEPDYDSSIQKEQPMPAPWGGTLSVLNYDPNFTAYAAAAGAVPVAGDFNGDGITDIALTAGSGWWTIPVAFSRGDTEGTFVATNSDIAGGDDMNFPYYAYAGVGVKVVGGDFNGDGMGDIALVGGSSWVTIPLAISNGDGTFNTNNDYWSGSSAFGAYAATATLIASGDFNHDGYSDIAVISGGGPIEVAFSRGDGKTFWYTSFANPFADLATEPNVQMVAGDYNGDGYADLLIVGGTFTSGAVIGELISEGNGNFNSFAQNLGSQLASFPLGGGVRVVSGSY